MHSSPARRQASAKPRQTARHRGIQGLRHQQTGSPGKPAIVQDAAPGRHQRCIRGRCRRGRDAVGGPHRPAREQRRLRCRPRRSGRELDRAGSVDLRDELLGSCPDDSGSRAPHATQGNGRIINIGSVLGFLPMPYGALYAATKHAIEGYSESLDHELRTRASGSRSSNPPTRRPASTRTSWSPTRRSMSIARARSPGQR